ncbi:hypothetical protein GCM10007933_20490 [Zoogloea oryzae]|uniref:Uncharacterized protein n=1 Tax=Zoogloea oryzae TaxID=310767 RepID=A0ABQ6FBD4_9RHOO|nr:hypothetical protein GCM10007933_20490 [Zoogloea oryzae]
MKNLIFKLNKFKSDLNPRPSEGNCPPRHRSRPRRPGRAPRRQPGAAAVPMGAKIGKLGIAAPHPRGAGVALSPPPSTLYRVTALVAAARRRLTRDWRAA